MFVCYESGPHTVRQPRNSGYSKRPGRKNVQVAARKPIEYESAITPFSVIVFRHAVNAVAAENISKSFARTILSQVCNRFALKYN